MKIKCPACQAILNIPDTAAGKVVKCPCGKQLRAPGAASTPPSNPTGQASGPTRPAGQNPAAQQPSAQRPGAQRPSAQQPGAQQPGAQRPGAGRPAPQPASGGFDPGIFDELTDQDLQPVSAVSQPGRPQAAPSSAGGKLMQQYAPTGESGYQPSGNMQIAGAGARLGGAILDTLFQGIGIIIGAVGFGVLVAATNESPVGVVIGAILLAFFVLAPMVINAVMIAKVGQTVGKKAVGTRIVMEATGQLPGFLQGWVIRLFVFSLIAQFVPFLPLIDALMVFSENAKTLHDRLAGTVVINA